MYALQRELNLTAVISQCPYLGNSPRPPLTWGFTKMILAAIHDVLRQAVGLSPKYIPAIAHPGEVGLMATSDAVTGMLSIVREEG